MTLKDHFILLARYNGAVNGKMYDILGELSDEKRKKETGAYFRSIHGILNHLIVSDLTWLRRYHAWHTDSVVLDDERVDHANLAWGRDMYEQFAELRTGRKEVDNILSAWIAELPETRYEEILRYTNTAGEARQYIVWQTIDHLFNHQTHHRGQISEILDEMEVEHDYSNILTIL
ncbi:MAG TPA: DinB family protein [Spirochaetia bacterium]|nr:DinB family protein [Spirochaetia bacterium]